MQRGINLKNEKPKKKFSPNFAAVGAADACFVRTGRSPTSHGHLVRAPGTSPVWESRVSRDDNSWF